MRSTDSFIRNKNKHAADEYKKIDTKEKSDLTNIISEQRKEEKKLYPMRVTDKITILVPKSKFNEEYKKKWMIKAGLLISNEPKAHYKATGENKRKDVDLVKVKAMRKEGYTLNQIGRELGYTQSFLSIRLKEEQTSNHC